MTQQDPGSALVLGGGGFVGSHIVEKFVTAGYRVTIVDGFLPRTGASGGNVAHLLDAVRLIDARVEESQALADLIAGSGVIVDAMGWTPHLEALEDPEYDLSLNAVSHLHVAQHLRHCAGARVIHLGSRGQYGSQGKGLITEDSPTLPQDTQGIHKVAGESYYRVFSTLTGFHVVSLRFPNCFGARQKTNGPDIGLVGSFIRTLLAGGEVAVYGQGRTRELVYAPDVAEVVLRLATTEFDGFVPLNMAGEPVDILKLARKLHEIIGSGSVRVDELPQRVAALDPGGGRLDESRLAGLIGPIPRTQLTEALRVTVGHFRTSLQ